MGERGWQACLERRASQHCVAKDDVKGLSAYTGPSRVLKSCREVLQTEQPDVCLHIIFSQDSEEVRFQPERSMHSSVLPMFHKLVGVSLQATDGP